MLPGFDNESRIFIVNEKVNQLGDVRMKDESEFASKFVMMYVKAGNSAPLACVAFRPRPQEQARTFRSRARRGVSGLFSELVQREEHSKLSGFLKESLRHFTDILEESFGSFEANQGTHMLLPDDDEAKSLSVDATVYVMDGYIVYLVAERVEVDPFLAEVKQRCVGRFSFEPMVLIDVVFEPKEELRDTVSRLTTLAREQLPLKIKLTGQRLGNQSLGFVDDALVHLGTVAVANPGNESFFEQNDELAVAMFLGATQIAFAVVSLPSKGTGKVQ